MHTSIYIKIKSLFVSKNIVKIGKQHTIMKAQTYCTSQYVPDN